MAKDSRRDFLRKMFIGSAGTFLGVNLFNPRDIVGKSKSSRLGNLKILDDNNAPVAFFFRDSSQNGRSSSTTWEEWYPAFNKLMGVEGKAFKEEVAQDDYAQVRDFFNRFKELNPEKAVILHLCGRARDPHFKREPFFAGHWAYYPGTTIQDDLQDENGVMDVNVSDPGLFRTDVGPKGRKANEDIGLCKLDSSGKPDWHHSEQVKLLDIDYENDTIKIERGCYGTTPQIFEAKNAYAASHVYEGPQGAASDNMRWYYNYSTKCPRDKNGKQAHEVFAKQIASWFDKGGILEKFDGLEFDVLHHFPVPVDSEGRGIDLNADGKADNGIFENRNTYGIGTIHFLKDLRQRMGEDRFIMADAAKWFHQRSVGLLNGTEHENFPTGSGDEDEFKDWAGAINRLKFAKANSHDPVFNYIKTKQTDERMADIRLAFAATVINDAALSMTIPSGRKELGKDSFIWDEIRKGQEQELGWLGKALEPTLRLATQSPNLISDGNLQQKIKSANCSIDYDNGTFKLSKPEKKSGYMDLSLGNFNLEGQDLFISATVKAEPMNLYPPETARVMYAVISGGLQNDFDKRYISNSAVYEGKTFGRLIYNMAFIHKQPLKAGFYFRKFNTPAELSFSFEGSSPVFISDISVHAAPDVIMRSFEGGVVIANPSNHKVQIDIKKHFPNGKFRRIRGSEDQDPTINNGKKIGPNVTIGKRDGLFLVRL